MTYDYWPLDEDKEAIANEKAVTPGIELVVVAGMYLRETKGALTCS